MAAEAATRKKRFLPKWQTFGVDCQNVRSFAAKMAVNVDCRKKRRQNGSQCGLPQKFAAKMAGFERVAAKITCQNGSLTLYNMPIWHHNSYIT